MERLGFGQLEHGLSLCAKRVLVQSDCRELVPEYFRFMYGLVDSEDLSERLAGDAPGQLGRPQDPQRAGQGGS